MFTMASGIGGQAGILAPPACQEISHFCADGRMRECCVKMLVDNSEGGVAGEQVDFVNELPKQQITRREEQSSRLIEY